MRNPLLKRLPREFAHNLGKYLGLLLLLIFAISMTTGFLAAASSIKKINADIYDKYNLEDLYFTTMYEASDEAIDAVEDLGCTVYQNFSRDVTLNVDDTDDDLTVRVFKNRTSDFDEPAYAEGVAPAADDEVALDRVFCGNHGLSVGDTVTIDGEDFTLTGIMTMPDYTVTYKSSGDLMFDAVTFTVAQMTPEAWERVVGDGVTYTYSVLFDDRTLDVVERTDLEEDIVDALDDNGATVTNLVDRDSNIGISFAADDVDGDMTSWEVLLVVLIVIMAFVFVVLTDATIEQESAVIGTLLASGWRKGEIIRHYMVLPTLIGIVGVAIGNILGYTLVSTPMKNLYYNSYGLPPYEATWHWDVFLFTSVAPFVLLVLITFLGLARRLRATPLQFLRHEASRKARRGGLRLPERLRFVSRFRLRVFLRNLSHFVILFFGIMFGSFLLLMGLCLMPVVEENADLMAGDVPADYLYVLKAPLKIDGTDEERTAWAAAEELSTDPAFAGLDLDLDLLDDLEDDLAACGASLDDLDDEALQTLLGLSSLTSEDVEKSDDLQMLVTYGGVDEEDLYDLKSDALHDLLVQSLDAQGVNLSSASSDQLTALLTCAHGLKTQLDGLDDDTLERFEDLLEDLSATSEELDDPVNQQVMDQATIDQAEKYAVCTLILPRTYNEDKTEEVTIYGIQEGSVYWEDLDVSDGRILVGQGVVEKCGAEPGSTVTFTDKYTNETYDLELYDTCGNGTTMSVYMSIDTYRKLFGEDADYFNGYASNEELALDERYVASTITPDDMSAMADQMDESMGGVMTMILWMAIPIYLVLIYLLTKTVIDRSATAISRMKVFGYHDGEIQGLYVRAITVTVIATMVLCIPILVKGTVALVAVMMADYSGNFVINIGWGPLAKMLAIGVVTYLAVAIIHITRIRRIPLAEALKVQE